MKCLVVLAVMVACCQGGKIENIVQKLVPSFSSGFVIKGHEAAPHSAPYIVSISATINHKHICGGSIIAKSWILTAGHCIAGNPINMSVVAGLHKRSTFDDKTQTRIVDFGKVHEKFSGSAGPYDIGILHLSEPLEFNQYVQPATLPAAGEFHSGETHLYGWGQSTFYNFAGASTLQTVPTEIIEFNECKEILPEGAPIHESNVCSSAMKKGISACNGDSGGPLVVEYVDRPAELIGIVSWGYIPCGVAKLPSVYTRVSYHIEWISEKQNDF